MGTGSRQRQFIDGVAKVFEAHGFTLETKQGRHYKIKISKGDFSHTWVVSCTPKNPSSAQRDALSDLRKGLRSNGINPDWLQNDGLLHMVQNGFFQGCDSPLKTEGLRKQMFDEEISNNDIDEIIDTIINTICIDSPIAINNTNKNPGYESSVTILNNNKTKNLACTKIVTIRAFGNTRRNKGYTFNDAIKTIGGYILGCLQITKFGIVVTDVWRPDDIELWYPLIEFVEQHGVKIVFVLKSGTNLYMIKAPWK